MLAFLLDENISPEVARQISEKRPEIIIASVHYWHNGTFKAQRDEDILIAAAKEELTFVTYDQKTIFPVLVRWGETGIDHSGVLFVDDRTIPSNRYGAIVLSLTMIWDAHHSDAWTNRVQFLRNSP